MQTVVRARERVFDERFPPPSPEHPVAFGAASDASFYEAAGIPSVVFGPGDVKLAHCRDESVDLGELTAAAHTIALAAMEWCGVA